MANNDAYPSPTYKGGVTDHGALTGTGDDDHTQYVLVDGTRAMTGGLTIAGALAGATTIDGSGDLTIGADTDRTCTLGRALIDSRITDLAYFSHVDMTTSGQHALRQNAAGATQVNGVGANGLALAISAGAKLLLSAASMSVTDGYDIVFGTTTGTQFGTAAGQKLAFYGATPIVQQTGVAVSAAGIHAALVNLGLITA